MIIVSKRICPIHGMWEKKKSTDRCQKCNKQTQKNYDTHTRDKGLTMFYKSPEWRKVRVLQLKNSPLCVKCERVATVADHIIEIKDGGCKLCLDNLQSMCNGCHTSKTASERKKRSEGASMK